MHVAHRSGKPTPLNGSKHGHMPRLKCLVPDVCKFTKCEHLKHSDQHNHSLVPGANNSKKCKYHSPAKDETGDQFLHHALWLGRAFLLCVQYLLAFLARRGLLQNSSRIPNHGKLLLDIGEPTFALLFVLFCLEGRDISIVLGLEVLGRGVGLNTRAHKRRLEGGGEGVP